MAEREGAAKVECETLPAGHRPLTAGGRPSATRRNAIDEIAALAERLKELLP